MEEETITPAEEQIEITVETILERGAKYLGNHPDHLTRRIVLAQILVDARLVRSIEAGINAFKIWSLPAESRQHPTEVLLGIANEKAKT